MSTAAATTDEFDIGVDLAHAAVLLHAARGARTRTPTATRRMLHTFAAQTLSRWSRERWFRVLRNNVETLTSATATSGDREEARDRIAIALGVLVTGIEKP